VAAGITDDYSVTCSSGVALGGSVEVEFEEVLRWGGPERGAGRGGRTRWECGVGRRE
jgi:hypothetical protein